MSRSAPSGGYDFGTKRHYRRLIWSTFRRMAGGLGDKQVLMMPSLEGDEIRIAARNGVPMRNIHVVDRNPAIVATLRRRFPGLGKTYGVPLKRMFQKLDLDDSFDVANLDLCSPLNDELLGTVGKMGSWMDNGWNTQRPSFMGVTMLRGRGAIAKWSHHIDAMTDDDKEMIRKGCVFSQVDIKDNDLVRMFMVALALKEITRGHIGGIRLVTYPRWGTYKSTAGNQTMLWMVYGVMNHDNWVEGLVGSIDNIDRTARYVYKGPLPVAQCFDHSLLVDMMVDAFQLHAAGASKLDIEAELQLGMS